MRVEKLRFKFREIHVPVAHITFSRSRDVVPLQANTRCPLGRTDGRLRVRGRAQVALHGSVADSLLHAQQRGNLYLLISAPTQGGFARESRWVKKLLLKRKRPVAFVLRHFQARCRATSGAGFNKFAGLHVRHRGAFSLV
jgi:hypothetical protein